MNKTHQTPLSEGLDASLLFPVSGRSSEGGQSACSFSALARFQCEHLATNNGLLDCRQANVFSRGNCGGTASETLVRPCLGVTLMGRTRRVKGLSALLLVLVAHAHHPVMCRRDSVLSTDISQRACRRERFVPVLVSWSLLSVCSAATWAQIATSLP